MPKIECGPREVASSDESEVSHKQWQQELAPLLSVNNVPTVQAQTVLENT